MKIGAVMFFTTDSMQPAALGRALEERGFESLWVPEHTHVPSTRLSAYPGGGGRRVAAVGVWVGAGGAPAPPPPPPPPPAGRRPGGGPPRGAFFMTSTT